MPTTSPKNTVKTHTDTQAASAASESTETATPSILNYLPKQSGPAGYLTIGHMLPSSLTSTPEASQLHSEPLTAQPLSSPKNRMNTSVETSITSIISSKMARAVSAEQKQTDEQQSIDRISVSSTADEVQSRTEEEEDLSVDPIGLASEPSQAPQTLNDPIPVSPTTKSLGGLTRIALNDVEIIIAQTKTTVQQAAIITAPAPAMITPLSSAPLKPIHSMRHDLFDMNNDNILQAPLVPVTQSSAAVNPIQTIHTSCLPEKSVGLNNSIGQGLGQRLARINKALIPSRQQLLLISNKQLPLEKICVIAPFSFDNVSLEPQGSTKAASTPKPILFSAASQLNKKSIMNSSTQPPVGIAIKAAKSPNKPWYSRFCCGKL